MIDALGHMSVPGIWAAGDLTSPFADIARAVAEGATCAFAVTHDLVATRHGLGQTAPQQEAHAGASR